MAEPDAASETAPKKKSKLPLVIGLVLALVLGGGGFYATVTGLILGPDDAVAAESEIAPLPEISFVPIDPMVISLGPAADSRHLRFTAQLEVAGAEAEDVILLKPRILDVMNSYLRAVDVAQLENPSALVILRAQMLRRMQIVTGEGRVRDLLITEFVLN